MRRRSRLKTEIDPCGLDYNPVTGCNVALAVTYQDIAPSHAVIVPSVPPQNPSVPPQNPVPLRPVRRKLDHAAAEAQPQRSGRCGRTLCRPAPAAKLSSMAIGRSAVRCAGSSCLKQDGLQLPALRRAEPRPQAGRRNEQRQSAGSPVSVSEARTSPDPGGYTPGLRRNRSAAP
jgi:hypothetical protein